MHSTAEGSRELKEKYYRHVFFKIVFIVALLVSLVAMMGYSCTISGREMTFLDGLSAIWNHIIGNEFEFNTKEWWDDYIVWNVTMPRVLGAAFAGAGLAVCGMVMQAVLRNPLAEPYTTGVSSGAVFGACLAIVMGFSAAGALSKYGLIMNAFLFGLVPAVVIIFLIGVLRITSPVTVILAGTAISYFFGGLTTLMLVATDEETLAQAYSWQVGSLKSITWNNVWLILIAVVVASLAIFILNKYLNVISMGDSAAKSLGVDVNKIRYTMLIISTIVVAAILPFTGIIGFVGLLVPHAVRMIIGGDAKYVLPASMLLGSNVLIFADTVSRFIVNVDIPVGAVMMFIGAPIFLYLMLSKTGRRTIY